MPPPNFDALESQRLDENVNQVDGGFVNQIEPHLIPLNAAARLLNVDPTTSGRLQKRLGPEPMGTPGVAPPTGLHIFNPGVQALNLMASTWGSNVYTSPGDDSWTRRATAVSLYPAGTQAVVGKINGLDTLFISNCDAYTGNASVPYGQLVALDGNFGYTQTSLQCRSLAWFQNRLFAYNLAFSGPTFLSWSKPLDGRDFSNGETVECAPGDNGVAVIPMRDGEPKLLLFNERSIYMLEMYWASDGFYPLTANALDFTKSLLRPISLGAGAVATRAITWVPGVNGGSADLMFLSRDGIRTLNRSSTDAQGGPAPPLSKPIQATIDRINWAAAHRSVSTFFDRFAYFAVPVDGSDNPNLVIAYDVTKNAWHEQDLPISAYATGKIGTSQRFFFQAATSATETGLGSPASGITNGYHVYEYGQNLFDIGRQPIQFDYQTRDFTFTPQSPGAGLTFKKCLRAINFSIQSANTHATLTFQYKLDQDDSWSDLGQVYIDPAAGFPYLNVTLPFSFSVAKVIRRSLSLRHLRPCFKAQFRIKDISSFSRLRLLDLTVDAYGRNEKFGGG